MLTAIQGVIQNNAILVHDDVRPYDGRMVTVIINDELKQTSSQDKSKFFEAVGKIDIDQNAVDDLRSASMI